MIPVRGRPLLWYSLRTAAELGCTDVVVVTRPGAEMIRNYVAALVHPPPGLRRVEAVLLRRDTTGPVETLKRAFRNVGNSFAVVLGDDFTEASNVSDLRRDFKRTGAEAAELVVWEADADALRRACLVRVRPDGSILSITEKPRGVRQGLRGCGVYMFTRRWFNLALRDYSPAPSPKSMTDLVAASARLGSAIATRLRGVNVNVNTLADVERVWGLESDSHVLEL
jgi:NDP-sugar pyrophosphorylase family protein